MSKFRDRLVTTGILVNDPTKAIDIVSSNSDTILGQLNNTGPFVDPWQNPIKEIESRVKKLETDNLFLRLKILSIEGKFTQEEVANIRKMLISEDSSSRALAECIIDNS